MKLTTARYYTPSGRSIQGTGISPDIEVLPARIENLAQGRLFGEADLPGALKNEQEGPRGDAPLPADNNSDNKLKENEETDNKTEVKKEQSADKKQEELQDYQLLRGMDLIKGIALFQLSLGNTNNKPKK
jgi:carboxyl-terminal processing protease